VLAGNQRRLLGGALLGALALGVVLLDGRADDPVRAAKAAVDEVADDASLQTATFAGGCFWSVELLFDELPGVKSAVSGYTGGSKENPTYEEVSSGATGHAEAVEVTFDPQRITYQALLDAFWKNIDPVARDGMFCDSGSQYRGAIFYHDAEQQKAAEASRDALAKSGRFQQPIATRIEAASTFYPAEEYHQDYHEKNPMRYRAYRFGCGRDRKLAEIWGAAPLPRP
jgi:peptide-methionine (S)-S-oxide reductase